MEREIITPRDDQHWHEMRSRVVTSTDVATLFDISPYSSKFETWHRKKNAQIVTLEPNARMTWGNRLEKAIAEGIAEDYNMTVRPMKEFIQVPAWRIGSSFDYAVSEKSDCQCGHPKTNHIYEEGDCRPAGIECFCHAYTSKWEGILEVKNVDSLAYKNGWLVDSETVEAPAHIEIQVQFQLLVSGLSHIWIGALIGGNRVVLIKREADLQIHEAIKSKVAEFWESIDANREPSPDFKTDADFISKMNGFAEPGKVMTNAPSSLKDMVLSYKKWAAEESNAKVEKQAMKAQILTLIGDHEKVMGDGYTITAGVTPPTLIEAHTRESFRNFRIYLKDKK